MNIIGISGTNGSGKDTLGQILADDHGYLFLSVTDLLREEARKRGLSVERKNMRLISAEWRRDNGLGVLIDKSVEHFKAVQDQYTGLAVASLRNPGEADRVHELGGKVVWVDGDPKTRYDRIQANAAARNRAEEDNITFEQFQAEELAEMTTSGDDTTLNMGAVKDRSDIFIENNSDRIDPLKQEVTKVLGL